MSSRNTFLSRLCAAALAIATLSLAACGASTKPANPTGQPSSSQQQPSAAAQQGGPPGGQGQRKQLSGQVAVATWGGGVLTTWRTAFVEPFARETGVKAVVQEVPSPQALAVSQAGNPQFDLLLVTAAEATILAQKEPRLYEPIDPSKLSRRGDVFSELFLSDTDGKWIAAPAYMTYYGILYNPQFVRATEVDSWEKLRAPTLKGRVMLNGPPFFVAYGLPLLAKARGGSERAVDPGFQLLAEIMPNVRTASTSLAEAESMIQRGEITVATLYFSDYGRLLDKGIRIAMAIPKEGGTVSPLYLMIPKGAKNVENAYALIDYVLGPAAQEKAQDVGSYIPVNKTVKLIPKIRDRSGFESPVDLMQKLYIPDWKVIAANRDAWVKRIEEIIAKSK